MRKIVTRWNLAFLVRKKEIEVSRNKEWKFVSFTLFTSWVSVRFRQVPWNRGLSSFCYPPVRNNTSASKVASAICHRDRSRYLATLPKIAGSVRRISDSLSRGFVFSSPSCQGALQVSALVSFCRSFLRTRRTAEEKFMTSTCAASCSILTMVRTMKQQLKF